MKILHIITNLNSGGAEKMLVKILENDHDNKNIVITLFETGFYRDKLEEMGIEFMELNLISPHKIFKKIPKIIKICKDIDVIHSWMYYANIFGLILSFLFNKRIIWNIRRSFLNKSELKKSTYLAIVINRLLSNKVNAVAYNSYIGKELHENFGFVNRNSIVISNGFEIEEKSNSFVQNGLIGDLRGKFNEPKFFLCNVARWEPLKDHKNLLEAVSLLKGKIDFHLILCGRNIDLKNEQLVSMIKRLELESFVSLLGERRDVDNIMQKCDLYISASKSEGFPNVLGEAMINKLLVVATDAGDSKYLLGNDELIVPVSDPVKLAERIVLLLSYEQDVKDKIISQAKNRVIEEFDIKEIVGKYNAIYKEHSC